MLIYVESKAFPFRTFVARCERDETIARVRAQLLHILYELGYEDLQFRLRFNGQYLRDAYTIADYAIVDNALLKMIPLNSSNSNFAANMSDDTLSLVQEGPLSILPDIKRALQKEVSIFTRREQLIYHFKGLLYIHFMLAILCFLTTYWYAGIWSSVIWAGGVFYCPAFTRFGGFIGKQSAYKNYFCVVYGTLSLASVAASIFFATAEWTRVASHGCTGWVFEDNCSYKIVFSASIFSILALCLLISSLIVWVLLWNIKIEYGDYVEECLVQNRDVEQLMKAAKHGRMKERRVAAFELATMAATSDDNKFRIVAEGGLEVLSRLALTNDVTTQEHALETLVELMTVPAIQDTFVEMGGVQTLTALLLSSDQRLVYQAASALSYIVSDSEENKAAVVADQGLRDLSYAAGTASEPCQRLISGIFLELAFDSDIRIQMSSQNTPVKALIKLCKSSDKDTQRFALQTIELLAIESAGMICAQEGLLELLLEFPTLISDVKIYMLAGKILLYYAENAETCEALVNHPLCKQSLSRYAHTKNAVVQKIVVKVIFCMLEVEELKVKAEQLHMNKILKYILQHAVDRQTWDMADQALQAMTAEDGLPNMPSMSTMEKVDKMNRPMAPPGESRLSLSSILSDSTNDLRNGVN